ncbi:MAG: DUF4277 domain-containing protein [Methanothrix sp.]|jgi:transposase|nr:DUF4277 domain-containing protein [Methanothrix sp.]
METDTRSLDHLGIVAAVFDRLGIADVIDSRMPKLRQHKLEHSVIVKAMVLNGLGFVGQRLYLFPEFYERLPVERAVCRNCCKSMVENPDDRSLLLEL